jgi:transcriptional regulator with XRE-family HTH domain
MPSRTLAEFGKRVKHLREAKGLSQESLAAKAGVHRTYIGMIERAEKNLTLSSMESIARALGIRIRDLVDRL